MSSPTAKDLVNAKAVLKDVPFDDDEIEGLAQEAVAIALSDARAKYGERRAPMAAEALAIVAVQLAALYGALERLLHVAQTAGFQNYTPSHMYGWPEAVAEAKAALAAVKGDA